MVCFNNPLLTHDSFQPAPNGEAFRTLEHQMLIGFGVFMADWAFCVLVGIQPMASGPGRQKSLV
ncbi:hypothetical protein OUZ56_024587 [Daphnia magna]|uniref:Uncharacterized protein n=1 Tax=Daphnia magna TaxID=35525 RepID=A0ABR0B110_9CRUS|nr:hypothetical protein OUZ56_024587 [Daphnia magna]